MIKNIRAQHELLSALDFLLGFVLRMQDLKSICEFCLYRKKTDRNDGEYGMDVSVDVDKISHTDKAYDFITE